MARLTVEVDDGLLEEARDCVAFLRRTESEGWKLSTLVEAGLSLAILDTAKRAGVDCLPERTTPLPRGSVIGRRVTGTPDTYDTQEVANKLGVSTSTVRKLVRAGQLPHLRVGRLLRFRKADFENYVAGRISSDWVPIHATRQVEAAA